VFINTLVQTQHMVVKIITEEGEEKRIYVCPYCNEVFETQNGYAGHIKRHVGKKRKRQTTIATQNLTHQQTQYYPPQNYQQQYYYPQQYYQQTQYYPPQHQQYYQPTWADIVMPTSYYQQQPPQIENQRRENGVPWWVIIIVIGGIGLLAYILYEDHKKEREKERKMLHELMKHYSSEIEKLKEFILALMPKGQKEEDDEEGE